MSKKIIIIAGPNGAGKTTFARSFLPAEAQCPRFINADLIAAGLLPFAPEAAAIKAGRLRKWPLREWPSVSSKGGHDIPEVVICRRFATGWKNFAHYREQVHSWVLYDNSGGEPIMIEWGEQA